MAVKKTHLKRTARKKVSSKPGKRSESKAACKHKPTGHSKNYCQIAFEYAIEAAADKKQLTFCKWVRLAAQRHLDDLKRCGSDWGYVFNEWHGNDVCDFVEKLPHIAGSWSTETISLEPPQIFILVCVFGWRKKSDGTRRFNRVYIEMARKNAKSTLTAGVALYCLCCEGEIGPEIIVAATTGEQAQKVFRPAYLMTKRVADLREAFGLETWGSDKYPKSITCADNGGFVQPINSKSSTQDGWNPHVGILDELHAHKDRGLFDVIRSAFGSRKNPLLWTITTAGYFIDGVCFEQRKLVINILKGAIQAEHYFGIVYTLDTAEDKPGEKQKDDDPLDPKVWGKANPLLGVSVNLDELSGFAKEAIASPESMGEFKTKRANIWTASKNGWINFELWKKCNGGVCIDNAKHYPVYGGLDLASTKDLTAFVLIWKEEDRLKVYCRFYLPEETVQPRTERNSLPYQAWVDEGYITVTPGPVLDQEFVKKDVSELQSKFDIQEIGFDKWNALQVASDLIDDGAEMIEVIQGPKTYHPAMKELERLYTAGMVDHGDNPVLNWMASNIVARKDVNENLAPDRRNSLEKIDGMTALLMALARLIVHVDKRSVYEDRGVIEVSV